MTEALPGASMAAHRNPTGRVCLMAGGLLAGLAVVVFYRAATQKIVYDEAVT
jgi:hypothetical protein